MQSESTKKDPVYALSESSPVRLGLVILLVGGCAWLVQSLNEVKETVAREFVPKELFTARMDSYQANLEGLKELVKSRHETFEARVLGELTALSQQVRALEQRVENGNR